MRTSVDPVSVAIEVVDRAGLAEEQQPGGDIEDVGRAERDDRGQIGERLERRIGALDNPGGRPADQQRQHGARRREHQRVHAGGEKVPAAQHRFEIAQPPLRGVHGGARDRHAALHQEHERRHHQRGQDHNQERRQPCGLPRRNPRPARRDRRRLGSRSDVADMRQIGGRGHERTPPWEPFWRAFCSQSHGSASSYLSRAAENYRRQKKESGQYQPAKKLLINSPRGCKGLRGILEGAKAWQRLLRSDIGHFSVTATATRHGASGCTEAWKAIGSTRIWSGARRRRARCQRPCARFFGTARIFPRAPR